MILNAEAALWSVKQAGTNPGVWESPGESPPGNVGV